MRSSRLLVALALLASTLLGACSSLKKSSSDLSFAQVQTIQPGLSAAQIKDAFGTPLNLTRGDGGRVTRMEYAALDAKQSRSRLILDFDAREILVTKTYTGEIVRP
jgi:outer membrane protein assembly factor BamE (lipoprotein component of BamABCDE complex)